jgi:hypothetical protein
MKPMKKFFMFFIQLMSSCQKFSESGYLFQANRFGMSVQTGTRPSTRSTSTASKRW